MKIISTNFPFVLFAKFVALESRVPQPYGISEPAIKTNKHNVNIAVYCLKSQTTSHGEFMYVCVLGLLFANTAAIKIIKA